MQVITSHSGGRQPKARLIHGEMASHQREYTSQHHGFQLVALIVREHTAGELLLIVGVDTTDNTDGLVL